MATLSEVLDPAEFARVALELHAAGMNPRPSNGENNQAGNGAGNGVKPVDEAGGDVATAQAIVERAAALVPEADFVSLTLRVRRGRYTTLAATHDAAEAADALQYQLGEGPCLDAAVDAGWIRSGDVAGDTRWPAWGAAVAEKVGVRSILAVQLTHNGHLVGALNIYGCEAGQFADRDLIDTVCVYSVHAATALDVALVTSELRTAISSRHVIGMAQGMLIERYNLDPDTSFEYLRRLASTHQIKVRQVAEHIVARTAFPPYD